MDNLMLIENHRRKVGRRVTCPCLIMDQLYIAPCHVFCSTCHARLRTVIIAAAPSWRTSTSRKRPKRCGRRPLQSCRMTSSRTRTQCLPTPTGCPSQPSHACALSSIPQHCIKPSSQAWHTSFDRLRWTCLRQPGRSWWACRHGRAPQTSLRWGNPRIKDCKNDRAIAGLPNARGDQLCPVLPVVCPALQHSRKAVHRAGPGGQEPDPRGGGQ